MDVEALKKLLAGANEMAQKPEQMMSVGEPAQVPQAEVVEAATNANIENTNDEAKSPNMMTKPELAEKQVKQEADKTVAGQMQDSNPNMEMLQKMRENITNYENRVAKKDEPNEGMNWLTGIGKGANVLAKSKGNSYGNVDYWQDGQDKKSAAGKKEDLNQLKELQKLYSDYQTKTKKKDDTLMTAYQKAQLEDKKADRDLKMKIAKLSAKNKAGEKSAKKSKLQEEKEKITAKRYAELEGSIPSRKAQVEEANELIAAIESGDLSSGPGADYAGRVGSFFGTEESTMKQRLDSLAEKAARSELKANGEVRPTDADVEGMKRALFNLGNTEESNVKKLQDFIRQQQAGLNEYSQMKEVVDNGGGLEDFLLDDTYKSTETKPKSTIRRKTKDGRVAIFDQDTKEFIEYEK